MWILMLNNWKQVVDFLLFPFIISNVGKEIKTNVFNKS